MYKLQRTSSAHEGFKQLVTLLDADLKIRDGEDHAFYAQYNKTDHIKNVVVIFEGDTAVACGAFKPIDDKTAEIKRMFVLPRYRGKGLAKMILHELECWSAELNYRQCILETGKNNPDAIALYQKAGYDFIPNYGQYAGVETSVCLAKTI